jgi:hypothetical protein
MQRVAAEHAKRQVSSGGLHPAGRVLEVAGKRLEQQDDQEVCQQVGLGGARIGSRWRLETNQTLQSLEAKLDAPSQSIEREYVLGGELVPCERGDQNDPIRGFQSFSGDDAVFVLCISPGFTTRSRDCAGRLLDCDRECQKFCVRGFCEG